MDSAGVAADTFPLYSPLCWSNQVRRGRGALTVFRHDQSLIPSPCQASASIRQARHSLAALPRTTANVNEPYEPDVLEISRPPGRTMERYSAASAVLATFSSGN
jgi:hypothetical protein